MDLNKLHEFVSKAGAATYAGGGKEEDNPQRPGFKELVYMEGDFSYRDSYTGFTRSRGPFNLTDGDWKYKYLQEGDIEEFNGYEEIYYLGELVFFHRIIGGIIKSK